MTEDDDKYEQPTVTQCVFKGKPPNGFSDWLDWVSRSTEHGLFAGVCISAATEEDWTPNT